MAEVKKNTADRVYENLFHMLVSGDYAPGDRIPSEHELKERFNVSRNTIRAALNRMNALGIIETRQGDGTYLKGEERECTSTALCQLFCLIRMI